MKASDPIHVNNVTASKPSADIEEEKSGEGQSPALIYKEEKTLFALEGDRPQEERKYAEPQKEEGDSGDSEDEPSEAEISNTGYDNPYLFQQVRSRSMGPALEGLETAIEVDKLNSIKRMRENKENELLAY